MRPFITLILAIGFLYLLFQGFDTVAQDSSPEVSITPTIQISQGEETVTPAERIENDLFLSGENLIIEQEVRDNALLLGQKVAVLKRVGGNLWVFANNIEIGGVIRKSMYAAARFIDIKDQIGGDAFFLAQRLDLNASISGSVYILAEDVLVNSNINDDIAIVASRVIFNGNTRDDLRIKGEEVYINSKKIEGNLEVEASKIYLAEQLDIEGDFILNGKVVTDAPEYISSEIPVSFEELPKQSELGYLGLSRINKLGYAGYGVFSLLLIAGDVSIAFMIFKLFPVKVAKAIAKLDFDWKEARRNILNATMFILITLIIIILCSISIIGLPISYVSILMLLLVLQTSKYLGFYKIGSTIMSKVQPKAAGIILNCFLGELSIIIMVLILVLIPVVGDYFVMIFAILFTLWTTGSLIRVKLEVLRKLYQKK